MKKFLSMLIVITFVLSIATTAFAMDSQDETTTSGWNTRFNKVQERIANRQTKIEQKKQEVSDFRTVAQEKSDLVKAVAEENKLLRQTITATRKKLAQIYTDMRAKSITLDASTMEQIINYKQQTKDIRDELMASKGSIHNCIENNKESLKSLDYDVLESTYEEIDEIQSWRKVQLEKINSILVEILKLVK